MSLPNTFGKLYLIPTTLGENDPMEVLPIAVKDFIDKTNYFIVENEKTARRFIKKISPSKSQQDLRLETLNKHTAPEQLSDYLKPCLEGNDVGVISEAGCPGVADPGAEMVALAHQTGIQVVPMVGPSSILLALMASGMNGQSFAFNGYLPIDKTDKKKALKQLEKRSIDLGQSQIFMETPYRNNKLLQDLTSILQPHTLLTVATDITLAQEFIKTKTVKQWRTSTVDLHKRPTIFVLHAS
ncbi:uroporphyrin-iii c/tetrapyrrole (corrin/porphyrin) methyltransferase [Galbibacter marinus]|uniref:Uroporphyrin-iii c/tetrapyrrole (Corrin/porphyrin) methyltransferase n=1 Tax=Galbibacter marinus TaxID=555500 RepID=K2P2Y9_9FLAO|nr:SAM-dependent methyltransferase [Galbibacter marinus]EKF55393.1 uroporphyrin-iii c/tetrapyrrole (corrin/porphyrin) methyltransferase [Galbibacter marinus]